MDNIKLNVGQSRIVNMDFSSLYPSTITMYFPKKHTKISKIEKILKNINDTR